MMATTVLALSAGVKRKNSNDDELSKRLQIILADDSYSSSSEEAESIYSIQNHDTATARDTSDTTDHEYEVRSLESEVTLSELSSGPDDVIVLGDFSSLVEQLGSEISDMADLSDTCSSSDKNIGGVNQCIKCQSECEEPFTLCLKCFRQKRIYLPPRPKRRRRNGINKREDSDLVPDSSQGSEGGSSQVSSQCSQGGENISQTSQQGQPSSQEPKNLCKCCFASPVDGVFIHKNSVHPMYCYKCSVKQWRLRGRCPFCNQKLCKVAKIFPVED